MISYEYVNVKFKNGFTKNVLEEHKQIIDNYASKGYRYIGYIPTKQVGYGMLAEIDLVFEIQIV